MTPKEQAATLRRIADELDPPPQDIDAIDPKRRRMRGSPCSMGPCVHTQEHYEIVLFGKGGICSTHGCIPVEDSK